MKRMLSLILCAALLLSASPVSRAAFSDVTDAAVVPKLDLLQALEIFSGVPGGAFRPDDILNRASFCVLAVRLKAPEDNPDMYASFIKFPDVRAGHWAVGWVNAASKLGLVSGYPDGSFGPADPINFGQTVTVLMHVLGYTDKEVGLNWPHSYISKAKAIGLTEGLNYQPGDKISRLAAAKMIYNLLFLTPFGGTTSFLAGLGVTESTAVLLSASALMPDGVTKAVLTSEGYVAYVSPPAASSLGRQGTMLIDKNDRLLSFVPDRQNVVTAVVGSTDNLSLTSSDGKRYSVPENTAVYYPNSETSKKYSVAWVDIRPGETVVLAYTSAGALQYLYLSATAATGGQVAVLAQTPTGNPVTQAFGAGAANAALYKNGARCALGDLARWDVMSYQPLSGTVLVSDLRLTALYETGWPNLTSPTKVTTIGETFSLLPQASAKMGSYKAGDRITFLFAPDGSVADVRSLTELTGQTVGLAGVCDDSGISEVSLPGGLTFSSAASLYPTYSGQLVTVSSSIAGAARVTRLEYKMPAGSFDVAAGKIGALEVSPYCRFYECAGPEGHLKQIARADLPSTVLPRSKVYHAGTDGTGKVTEVVLDCVTYDCYQYGPVSYEPAYDDPSDTTKVTGIDGIYAGEAFIGTDRVANQPPAGTVCGIAAKTGPYRTEFAGFVTCNKYAGLSRYDFQDGKLLIQGRLIPIADGVKVFIPSTKQTLPIEEARAFASSFEAYTDPGDVRVRYIVGK